MVLVYDRWKVSKNKYEGLISQITLWSSIDRSQETDSNSGVPGVALARSCGGSRSCIHSRNGGWHSVLPGRVFDCNPRVCLSIRPSVWARDARDAANDRSAWWQRTVFGTRATLAGCSGSSSSSNRGVSDPWHPWRQKRVLYALAPFSSSSPFQRERCAKAAHHSSPVYPHLRDCEIAVCLFPFSFLFFEIETLSLFLCKMQLYEFRRNFVYFYSTFPFCVKTHGKDFADICFVRRKFVGNILRRFSKHYNSILFESHTVVNLQSTTIRA